MTSDERANCYITLQTELEAPDENRVANAVACAAEAGGNHYVDVHVVFCDDEEIAGVHGEFFNDPTPTDVITFPDEGDGTEAAPFVGELLVSVQTAATAAAGQGHSTETEALLYVIHGVLHLCGLDDLTAEGRVEMRQAERVALQKLGLAIHYFE